MKKLFLSNFTLKIIAIISMTFDHLGFLLMSFSFENQAMSLTGYVFRIIGRLSLPLFCLLIVEGSLKTKNFKKYLIRLGIVALLILIFQFIVEMLFLNNVIDASLRFKQGNIFLTLIASAVMIKLFQSNKRYIKILGALPIIYGLLCFVVNGLEYKYNMEIYWLPYYLRGQYDILAIAFSLGIYLSYKILPLLFEFNGLNYKFFDESAKYRFYLNLISSIFIILINLAYYSIIYIDNSFVFWDAGGQLFAIFSVLFILFYNGKRGYDNKIVRVITYSYYPAHLIILYLIFALIFIF